MADETNIQEQIDRLTNLQGWNDHSLKTLFLQFIQKKQLGSELVDFLWDQVNDENAENSEDEDNAYVHLTLSQYEQIHFLAVEMEMQGDGENRISKEQAERTMKGMLVCDMLDRMGYDEEGRQDKICKRLGFNPETGRKE